MLRITEIFFSIQGEARYVGLPSVFVRLTGCPMRCVYCDSAYAFHGGEKRSIEQILEEVQQYETPYITVTGGEPLAQPECVDLLKQLCDRQLTVSIETGNAMSIAEIDPRVHVVLDIKTPDSGEESNNRYDNLAFIKPTDQLKFVICSRADYEWSKEMVAHEELDQRCEILFSPAAEQLSAKNLAEWILEDQVPVRFQMQLHKPVSYTHLTLPTKRIV